MTPRHLVEDLHKSYGDVWPWPAWIAAILVVFVPLAARKYRRTA